MRNNFFNYILLILLVLMIFGVISFGDILSVVFYIIMGILLLVLVGVLYFRYRMNRVRREMERQARQAGGGYYNPFGGSQQSGAQERKTRQEGEVTVKRTSSSSTKRVSNQVGDYVEYEEIDEEEVTG